MNVIEFKKEERDCQWNREAVERRKFKIYDFAVIVDGVRRATWERDCIGRGYLLRLKSGATAKIQGSTLNATVKVKAQAGFMFRTVEALKRGEIPA